MRVNPFLFLAGAAALAPRWRGQRAAGDIVTAADAVAGRLYRPYKAGRVSTAAGATAYKKTKLSGHALLEKLRNKQSMGTLGAGGDSQSLMLLMRDPNREVFERATAKASKNPIYITMEPDYALVEVLRIRDTTADKADRKEAVAARDAMLKRTYIPAIPIASDEKPKTGERRTVAVDRLTGQKFEVFAKTRPREYLDDRSRRVQTGLQKLQGDLANMEAEGVIWGPRHLVNAFGEAQGIIQQLQQQRFYDPTPGVDKVWRFKQYGGGGKSLRKAVDAQRGRGLRARRSAFNAIVIGPKGYRNTGTFPSLPAARNAAQRAAGRNGVACVWEQR